MRKINLLHVMLVVFILLFLSACGQAADDEETDLAVQLTLAAIQQTQTSVAAPPQEQPTQELPTLQPQDTLDPNVTPVATATPIPCNRPRFQSETIPDGTQMKSEESFVKSWRIRNDGTCTWNTNYKFVFSQGDRMGGQQVQNLSAQVVPGEMADFTVNLKAPKEDGVYKGYWKLQSDEGEYFGNYWVEIVVGNPQPAFAVTRVTYNVKKNIDMSCPNTINVKAEITSSAAGTVTYFWRSPGGDDTATKSLKFDAPGKKIIDYNPEITASGDYKVRLYIDEPNHQWFDWVSFTVNCS